MANMKGTSEGKKGASFAHYEPYVCVCPSLRPPQCSAAPSRRCPQG
jgi:hypothetical protein